jgi:hypothetical protein
MLHGYIDVVTSSGYVDGWAWDTDQPYYPLIVALIDHRGNEIAWGSAHRYRGDLVTAKCGVGWCAFRLRLMAMVDSILNVSLTLMNRTSNEEIYRAESIPFVEAEEAAIVSIEDVCRFDPTALDTIDQLRGCEDIFAAFIRRYGVDVFIRTAYVYVLGRPADVSGRSRYARLLRQASITPFSLLLILSESDEFRSRPRLLSPPNQSGFPFHAV